MLEAANKGEISLTAEGWYDVTLLATGDAEHAERTRNDFIRARLRKGLPVE